MDIKISERLTELVEEDKIEEFCSELGFASPMFYRWRKGVRLPSLTNAVKIADYFGYSLDFIIGRSEDDHKTMFKPCADFSQRLRFLMKEKNTNPYRLSREAHIGRKTIYQWLNGTTPTVPLVIILADKFDCTTDYLLGRE